VALFVAVGAALSAGCKSRDAEQESSPQGHEPIVVAADTLDQIAALPFETHEGVPVSVAGLAGKPVLMSFIYTRCAVPNMCPLTTRNVARVQELLSVEERAAVRLVSLTFDPEYDTGDVLKDYAQSYGADLDSWQFWRGTPADTERLMGAYNAWAMKQGDEYGHNMRSVILRPDGSPSRVLRDSTWDVQAAATHLRELVADPM